MRGLLLIFLALPLVYWGTTLGLCSEAELLCEQAFFSASLGTGLRRVVYPLLLITAVILLVRGIDEYRRADLKMTGRLVRRAGVSVIAIAGFNMAFGNWIAGVPLLLFGLSIIDPGLPDQHIRLSGVALVLLLLSIGFGSWGVAAAGSTLGLALASHRVRLRPFRGMEDETVGRRSQVRTVFLDMWLDQTSGAMGGRILGGRFAGSALDVLPLDDLMILHEECGSDPQSLSLIEAWLDRRHSDWRERLRRRATPPELPSAGRMTEPIALQILGVEAGADEQAINQAHRALIRRVHPDQGGSHYFAALVNEARDHLLRRRRRMN